MRGVLCLVLLTGCATNDWARTAQEERFVNWHPQSCSDSCDKGREVCLATLRRDLTEGAVAMTIAAGLNGYSDAVSGTDHGVERSMDDQETYNDFENQGLERCDRRESTCLQRCEVRAMEADHDAPQVSREEPRTQLGLDPAQPPAPRRTPLPTRGQ